MYIYTFDVDVDVDGAMGQATGSGVELGSTCRYLEVLEASAWSLAHTTHTYVLHILAELILVAY